MKQYKVTKHAVDRAVERLGWQRTGADHRIAQLMQSAYYQGEISHRDGKPRKVFDHHKSRVRMVIGDDGAIVTVYPMEDSASLLSFVPDDLAQAIRKKAATLSRKYTKELRQVERELALTNVKIAEKELAKLRVNNPKTKAFIDAKLTELTDMCDGLAARQSELTEQLRELAKHQ